MNAHFYKSIVSVVMIVVLVLGLVPFTSAQETVLPPLSEPGPYGVRVQALAFVDESRDDWEVKTFIWYPADKAQGTPLGVGTSLLKDGPPDRSGAPYPLIVFSHGWQGAPAQMSDTIEHLVSHGYIVAGPQHHDTQPLRFELVDRPLDILVVLEGLSAISEGDLAGMIDPDNVGLMGYSQGGDAVLQMLGLLRDPVHYASWCAEHPDLRAWDCNPPPRVGSWPLDEITAYRAQLGLQNTPGGQWAPFGDERVRAVLAMAPGDFPLTTEDMLASVITPTMILHGNHDEYCDYEGNAVRTYTHLGTEDRYLITVINGFNRAFTIQQQVVPRHYATAFFGYYLQDDESYKPYLTEEHLPDLRYVKLAWGPYEGD